jgi:oxygen-independent coproporphyrinogen-3 oxidase
MKYKSELVESICSELILRKDELEKPIETIYFGGGTPSLLTKKELNQILDCVAKHYQIIDSPEISLEANPDDLSRDYLIMLKKETPVNRLSIGVQSFFEKDLKLMNRAHNAKEAVESIKMATDYFTNISIDLIYGIPNQTSKGWLMNLEKVLELNIPHVSSYALTVEPNTALHYFIEKEVIPPADDELAKEHFEILFDFMNEHGFEQYEFSNFGKPGYLSKNNTAYWTGKNYLGIGPSAHSLVGNKRSWNVSNNRKYIKSINAKILPSESESLDRIDRYNEYIMTRLRTKWGVDLNEVEKKFGKKFKIYVTNLLPDKLKNQLLIQNNSIIKIHPNALFLSDGIAAELFMLKLQK